MRPAAELSITGFVEAGKGTSTRQRRHERAVGEAAGWTPVPGTLNLYVGKSLARVFSRLPGTIEIPDERGEPIAYRKMAIDDIDVMVRSYRRTLEVFAPVHIRDHFGVKDGDEVTLTWRWRAER